MVAEGCRGKLRGGVKLARLHPEWDRECSVCEKYIPREDGSFVLDRRTALPVLSYPGAPKPCHKCLKVPAGVRASSMPWKEMQSHAVSLTPQHRQTWRFYRECRAVGQFPPDAIVRWAAAILREVEEECDRLPTERLTDSVLALVEHLKRKGR